MAERFPHLTHLDLRGIILSSDRINLDKLPLHLVSFVLNVHAKDSRYTFHPKQLANLPVNLETLVLQGIDIVFDDILVVDENDEIRKNFYSCLPKSLTELEVSQSKEIAFDMSVLPQLRSLQLRICSLLCISIFLQQFDFATSKISPQLEEFTLKVMCRLSMLFDAPLSTKLVKFYLVNDIIQNFNYDIIRVNGLLEGTNLLESRFITDNQKVALLQKMSSKATDLDILCTDSSTMKEMSIHLPRDLKNLTVSCYTEQAFPPILFDQLSKLNLEQLKICVSDFAILEQSGLPFSLKKITFTLKHTLFNQQQMLNVLKAVPKLEHLEFIGKPIDDFISFLIGCSSILPLLSSLNINCKTFSRGSNLLDDIAPLTRLKQLDFAIQDGIGEGTRLFGDVFDVLLPNLEVLSFSSGAETPNSKGSPEWMSHLPKTLKIINIEASSVLFEDSSDYFQHLPPRLEVLSIKFVDDDTYHSNLKNEPMTEEFAHKAMSRLPSSLVILSFPFIPEKTVPLLPLGMAHVQSAYFLLASYFMQDWCRPYREYALK